MKCKNKLNWSPFSTPESELIELVNSNGIYLWDKEGNKYTDMYSGLWNMNFGHKDLSVEKSIIEQLKKLPFYNPIVFKSELNERVALKLFKLLNVEKGRIIYGTSGSEGVEIAIKIARKYSNILSKNSSKNKKNKIAVIDGAYHGTTYAAMSASRYSVPDEGYKPLLDGFISLPSPLKNNDENQILSQLEEIFNFNQNEICAILIEPILASAGVIRLFDKYVKCISEFCNKNGALLVSDEVSAGFYRTNDIFGFQEYKLKPDIVIMSKGMNNGYLPLSATYVNSKIVDQFASTGTSLDHMSTQGGNPICLASANAILDYYFVPEIINKITTLKKVFKEQLHFYLEKVEKVKQIRIEGLMAGIEVYVEDFNELFIIVSHILKKNIVVGFSYFKNRGTILLFPSYITKEKELSTIIQTIREVLKNDDK
ncbi:aminotransferase, class III [Fusobacterium sp. CM21]|jgi:aminotransferase class-III|uniref:class-III pyridoxal-phosphate-dependent aminotransferase n=1 Tax=Fusobacterium nucleatum TaxID=851 RepID=UPI0003E1F69C|nr:aspartate aminotransferase family protein [Fusobacterium nucleatum]ETT13574.1 aminotransferase, class III [Fusobacterium sp. CM21]OHU82015.1 hypothetical protein BKN39_06715 [Fusobacterium nucleatum]